MATNRIVLVLLSGCALTSAEAKPVAALACPESVSITVPAVEGWEHRVASELYLNSATPISGPPGQRGDLAEFTTRKGKDEWSYTYNLDRPFPNGKWLECGYGTHNEVTLSKPLPAQIRTCTFTYRKGAKAGQHAIRIACG